MLKTILSLLCNAGIIAGVLWSVPRDYHRKYPDGTIWGTNVFRYFTTDSNIFCAIGAVVTFIATLTGSVPYWVTVLKYLGSLAVLVTFVTVMVFLGPTTKDYKGLCTDSGFYLHVLCPILAVVSFCFTENAAAMPQGMYFIGVLTVVVYSLVYLTEVIIVPEKGGAGWPDFYGFNMGGHWPVSMAAMYVGTALLCLVMYGLSRIPL